MSKLKQISFKTPSLIFLGDITEEILSKVGKGIAHWRPESCIGQLRLKGCVADLGLEDLTIQEAVQKGAKSLIIGVAPIGGKLSEGWQKVFFESVQAGLDIVSGFHSRLKDIPGLAEAAEKNNCQLIDVRVPPPEIPVGTGKKRTGYRLLTVGTDCAVGKKYTALAIQDEMKKRAINSTFRATGQTGIMIAGEGIPIDAVVSDFVSGAAEILTPDNSPDHWDVIEGQGSLFHPGYAAVSLGLLHGAQPDAIVVCHDATRQAIDYYPDYSLPDIPTCIERNLLLGSLTNPSIICAGVSVNTSELPKADRERYLEKIRAQINLPVVDPLVEGPGEIVDFLQEKFKG